MAFDMNRSFEEYERKGFRFHPNTCECRVEIKEPIRRCYHFDIQTCYLEADGVLGTYENGVYIQLNQKPMMKRQHQKNITLQNVIQTT